MIYYEKFHKRLTEGMVLCLTVFLLAGCSVNSFVFEKSEPFTYFPPYTQSVTAGTCQFVIPFFFNEEERDNWNWWNFKSVYLRIGGSETKMSLDTSSGGYDNCNADGTVYLGTLILRGEIEEPCSGDMTLLVDLGNEEGIREYALGTCSVVSTAEAEDDSIVRLQAGAVAGKDETGTIFTYGNIVRLETDEDITVRSVDLGLDSVGVDVENYVVLTYDEYKKILDWTVDSVSTDDYKIYSLEDNLLPEYDFDTNEGAETTTWDTVWEDAFTKKKTDSLHESMNLALKKGEYYIYFPFEFLQDDTPAVVQSVVRIEYDSSGEEGNYYVSKPFTYFTEQWKSESFLRNIFREAVIQEG